MSQNKTSDSKLPNGNKLPHYVEVKEELDDGTIGYYCDKCNKWEKYCKCNNSNIALLKNRVENLIRKTQSQRTKEIILLLSAFDCDECIEKIKDVYGDEL